MITQEIPAKVAVDTAYQNARLNSDRQNARVEHDKSVGCQNPIRIWRASPQRCA